MENRYVRTYCTNCKNFTVHSYKNFLGELFCRTCDNEFNGYTIGEVEPHLIEEQRQRYNNYRLKNVGGLYGAFLSGVGVEAIMNLERRDIQESSAGQEFIDEENRRKRQEIREQKEQHRQLFLDNYSHLNRNDKCACGSGKKYKQCHLNEFKQY